MASSSRWKQQRLISCWSIIIYYYYLMLLPTCHNNQKIIAAPPVFAFMAATTTFKRRRQQAQQLPSSSLKKNCGCCCYYISRRSVSSTTTSSSALLLSTKKKKSEEDNFSSISQPHLRPSPPVAPREEDRYLKIDYYHKKKPNHDNNIDDSSSTREEVIYQEELKIPNPYGWMRDDTTRTSKKVLDYIQQENEYTRQYADDKEQLLQLQTDLTNEFQQFIPINNDISQVYELDEYYYFIKRIPYKPYPLHCRWRYHNKRSQKQQQQDTTAPLVPLLHTDDDYQVILDENKIAAKLFRNHNNNNSRSDSSSSNGNDNDNYYFAIHSVVPSPSHRFVAYSVDITGNETYDIFIHELNLKEEEEEDQNNNNNNNNKDDDDDDIKIASNVAGNIVWGATDDYLYFVGIDQQLFRPYQLYQWKKNDSSSSTTAAAAATATTTTILKEEVRPNISCELYKSMDRQYLFWITQIMHHHNNTGDDGSSSTNVSALDLSTNQFIEISWSCPKKSILLKIEHRDGFWWALSMDEEENGDGAVILSTIASTSTVHDGDDDEDWTKIDWDYDDLDHSSSSLLSSTINDMHILQNHIILQGRGQDGLAQIWFLKLDDEHDNRQGKKTIISTRIKHAEKVEFFAAESARYCSVGRYQEYNSDAVTITYESMVSPPQILRVNLNHPNNDNDDTAGYDDAGGGGKKRIEVLQQTEIPGYSKENYVCHGLEVVSRDGQTKIPVSIVYRRRKKSSNKKRRPGRLHLLGYGSYGHSLEPAFSALKVPLLNRGIICAIAHVRGGGELGHNWYKEGSGLKKKNSINDFIDVARWLCGDDNNSSSSSSSSTTSWTKPDLLSCEGRSAGGLLVAAAVNEDPTLFRSVFLGVPFLDVLASMSDPTLPLTSLEYDEWGNPHQLEGLRSIQDYCPIQNIKPNTVYPSFWIAASLHDPRTPYWESLKYAATLRHQTKNWSNNNINNRPICVKVDTNAGHSLGSNRTRFFEEMGCIYAFLLSQFDDEENMF